MVVEQAGVGYDMARSGGEGKSEGDGDGSGMERWLLTYADLITLLMIFCSDDTMSQIDAQKLEAVPCLEASAGAESVSILKPPGLRWLKAAVKIFGRSRWYSRYRGSEALEKKLTVYQNRGRAGG